MSSAWEERRLCDDGACTGLIGNDGLCRVCGHASKFWGDERRRGMQDDDGDEEEAAREVAKAAGGADDDDDRALCPDGSCTGLLDIDGRCKVCGKVDESVRSRVKATPARDADRGDDADGADGGDEGDAGDDDDRQLCPDGACTGLIGNDGACRVCGRRIEA